MVETVQRAEAGRLTERHNRGLPTQCQEPAPTGVTSLGEAQVQAASEPGLNTQAWLKWPWCFRGGSTSVEVSAAFQQFAGESGLRPGFKFCFY